MDNFFTRAENRTHAWPAGRADLHWHLLFPVEDVRERLTDPYRELTNRPGLEPVAPEWLHMTVLHSGPRKEATDQEVETFADRVRQLVADEAPSPLGVTFAPPAVGNVAVECIGRPGPPARRLWELTARAQRDVFGDRWPLMPARYYPHVSLAYGGTEAARVDRQDLKVWLSDYGRGDVTLHADRLVLVAQSHDRARITWEVLEEVPLTGPVVPQRDEPGWLEVLTAVAPPRWKATVDYTRGLIPGADEPTLALLALLLYGTSALRGVAPEDVDLGGFENLLASAQAEQEPHHVREHLALLLHAAGHPRPDREPMDPLWGIHGRLTQVGPSYEVPEMEGGWTPEPSNLVSATPAVRTTLREIEKELHERLLQQNIATLRARQEAQGSQ